MANTRDTLGDQVTLDGLVSHTLETFEDNEVTSLRSYAFHSNKGLKRVKLPNLTAIPEYAFYNAGLTKIEVADMSSVTKICSNSFYGNTDLSEVEFSANNITLIGACFNQCKNLQKAIFSGTGQQKFDTQTFTMCLKLHHLVLNGTTKATRKDNILEYTPINRGEGAVYVPTDMVTTYRADANWGKLIIEDIANYPLEKFETITDSWAEIVANQNYATDYKIGDTKAIKIGDLWYTAEIVGINKDVDANGDTIPLTWMLIDLLADKHRMNATSTNANGWVAMEMRSYLISDILPNIDIKDLIVPCVKTFYDRTTQSTLSCTDSIWIPSLREMGGSTVFSTEDSGCIYDERFANKNKSKYVRESANTSYWLRSATNSANGFLEIQSSGGFSTTGCTSAIGVLLGFCTM